MERITLNGKVFSPENLNDVVHHLTNHGEEQSASIAAFLREWWADTSFIKVSTSGSTGEPKEIRLPKKVVEASARLTIQYFSLNEDSSGLLCLPARYIAGKLMLVRAICSGMSLEVRKPGIDVLAEPLPKIDFAAMIPQQVAHALKDRESAERLQTTGSVLIGGGPVEDTLERQLQEIRGNYVQSYGMTETATHIALRNISQGDKLYSALPGVSFSVDHRGCLVIEAAHLPEKIVTNDLVELTDAHHFRWLGRFDHAIISGGIKYIPEVLEQKLAPFIESPFYITGTAHSTLGESIELIIEGHEWPEERIEKFRLMLASHLHAYEVPKSIRFVAQFERTPTGKIKRSI